MINELFISFSILSSLASFCYIILYILFIELRQKLVYKILFRFQLSIFFSALSTNFGLHLESGGILCWIEGVGSNIFTLSAVFWLVYLTHVLHNYVLNQYIIKTIWRKTELFCWIFPLIVTLLPLTTSTYGNINGDWCWVIETETSPYWASHVWFWISYYLWIWISIIGMFIYIAKIAKFRKTKVVSHQSNLQIERTLRNLVHYSLIVIICWIPSTVYDYCSDYYPDIILETYTSNFIPVISVGMGFFSNMYLFTTNVTIKKIITKFFQAKFDINVYILLRRESAFNKKSNHK